MAGGDGYIEGKEPTPGWAGSALWKSPLLARTAAKKR